MCRFIFSISYPDIALTNVSCACKVKWVARVGIEIVSENLTILPVNRLLRNRSVFGEKSGRK